MHEQGLSHYNLRGNIVFPLLAEYSVGENGGFFAYRHNSSRDAIFILTLNRLLLCIAIHAEKVGVESRVAFPR